MVFFLILFLILTVLVLVIGLLGFASNSESYQKNGNKLMRLRLLFQLIALVFAMIVISMASRG